MKTTLLCVFTLIGGSLVAQNDAGYSIKGTNVPAELNGQTIYLRAMDSDLAKRLTLDSAQVTNGQFEIKGNHIGEAVLANAEFNEWKAKKIAPFDFILENGNIALAFGAISTASGTANNDTYQQFREIKSTYEKESQRYRAEMNQHKDDPKKIEELQTIFVAAYYTHVNEIAKYIKPYVGTLVGATLFTQYGREMKYTDRLDIISRLPKNLLTSRSIVFLNEKSLAEKATAVGNKYTDLKSKAVDGTDLAISDIAEGNYVLLDFWASWCAPCVAEIPHLQALHAKYKDKGFVIFGISVDQKKEDWLAASEKFGVVWPQIIDEIGFGQLPKTYGVTGVPHTILIDKNGIIIERNLRGQALVNKIDELMKD